MSALPATLATDSQASYAMPPVTDQTFAVAPSEKDHLGFYGFVPSSWNRKRWMVSIHGYSRNAAAHITQFAQEAKVHRSALIAPIFPRDQFTSFQTLSPSASGQFPEDAFERCLDRASAMLCTDEPPSILGYSGGGQFLHRFLMMRMRSFNRTILFAPGWYTWPDRSLPYPYGTGPSKILQDRRLSIRNLSSTPITVMVGTKDIRRDGTLNTKESLNQQQGTTRLERAERWVDAMNDAVGSPLIKLQRLRGMGHDFTRNIKKRGLARIVFSELSLSQNGHYYENEG